MSGSASRPHLRLVKVHDEVGEPRQSGTAMPSRQPLLFSDASSYTLGFIKAGDLDADRLVKLIEDALPQYIFDLRPAPSFARGAVPRRTLFSLFEKHKVEYFDVAGALGVTERRDGLLNPGLLVDALQVNILRSSKGLAGPVFFFVDDELFHEDYFTAVADRLPHQDGRGWDIACWPNDTVPNANVARDLVFLSHANPEDNEIATWFSARLAAHGYKVWSDVTRLIGGEVIWDTVEQAIRERAAKIIVLLSKRGHQKPGLLDEVNVAVATERAEGLERFIVPVRIDDLPFTSVRANLSRKNIVDGSSNLADALRAVLQVLEEDGVPKSESGLDTIDWAQNLAATSEDSQWDFLIENKIEVKNWPSVIRKFRSGISSANLPFVSHPVSGGIVTFDSWADIARPFGGQVQKVGEALLAVKEWPSNNELVFSGRGEMRRALASLARQAWDRHCASIGLENYQLSNRSVCWFLRRSTPAGSRIRFVDHKGVERTKVLVGQSPRRGVYWHFAVEARPNISDNSIRLVPHVLFSVDGITPIADVHRQHSLRRSFCRSWWNARWRDLLAAWLMHLSRGEDVIHLPVSNAGAITLSARLSIYDAKIESAVHRYGVGDGGAELVSFEEPKVAVGYNQTSDYPKEGLLQFGPVSFRRNPTAIRTGVIGTREGIELFQRWSDQFNNFRRGPAGVRNSFPFPGFEAVFGAKWPKGASHTIALSRTDVINSVLLQDRHQAVFKTCGLFVDAISKALKNDDVNVDVWYVVIPDEVYVYGRPESRVPSAVAIATPNAMGRRAARRFTDESPSLFSEDNAEALIYNHHLDFHHQLKERLLGVQAVTQILRESSLATVTSSVVDNPMPAPDADSEAELNLDSFEGEEDVDPETPTDLKLDGLESSEDAEDVFQTTNYDSQPMRRQMQDPASFAWNIGTTTFFKAGGRPWRVASAREGVCYIGLIFKRDKVRARQACCGAQMFLDDSDGLVFKGAMGPWYSPETGQFHLDRAEASRLIKMVIAQYEQEHKKSPREIFIHGKTRFNEDEWRGFCDSVDLRETKLTAIRISRSNEFKLYSSGELAVKRGTALKMTPFLGLLWTTGYVPRLGTYPGRETPNPLRIEVVKESDESGNLERVMQDILVLTKMNFNSCVYADGVPVTLRFAEAIGDVLLAARDRSIPPLPFRYYI